MKTYTYWFTVVGIDSDLLGEEFFVEIKSERETAKQNAIKYAQEIFPNEKLKCLGRVSDFEAECMGLDTY